jgi:hypothetical protein
MSLGIVVLLATSAFMSTLAFRSGDEVIEMPMIARATRPSDHESVASDSAQVGAFSGESEQVHNALPLIEGEPPPFVVQGTPYLFEPEVFDLDFEQQLTFSISGKPPWAMFEPSTGAIMGVPLEEDVGRYEGIVITVSDGVDMAALEFSIEVVPSAAGTALIRWTPPSDTIDGSPFPGISGYRLEYGQSPNALLQVIDIDNIGVTSYVVDNLTPGAWYFHVIVYDQDGLESEASTLVQKIVE